MGDWVGQATWKDGSSDDLAVRMIPDGDGRYRLRVFSTFAERVPVQHELLGRIADERFVFLDDLPLEAAHVLRSVEDGLVVRAAMWSGEGGNRVAGSVSGRLGGSFVLEKQEWKPSPTLGREAPEGAVALFDGSDLDHWVKRGNPSEPAGWKLVEGGAMEVAGGDIMTREKFGDHELHLEFRLPYMPGARGQGRANSGVYPQGRYELQVLDSYGLNGEDNECGGIYTLAQPLVNMCAPPLVWQTYDITFRAPRFASGGERISAARITVVHNGTVIHDDLELEKPTGGALNGEEEGPGPLLLQDHGNPVWYRNIWARPLE